MFNFNELAVVQPNEPSCYRGSFVGIRKDKYLEKMVFTLPKGFENFETSYDGVKKLFFAMYRTFEKSSGTHLFCFPYAGGSISALRPLAEHVSPTVDVHIASLPGRASRFAERPVKQLSTLVSALADAIDQTQPERFVLYGHSMGGILGFEITRECTYG